MELAKDSRLRQMLLCLAVALVVGAAGFGFDRVLVNEGVPRTDILLLSNALTGLVAAVFYFYLSNNERQARRRVKEQLRIIGEMNHHIRNALQVITYVAGSNQQEEQVQMIRSSVERIEWALREVLPGYAAPEHHAEQFVSSAKPD